MMTSRIIPIAAALCLPVVFAASTSARQLVHHELKVRVEPERNSLVAEDRITLPAGPQTEKSFLLHAGLHPVAATPGVRVEKEGAVAGRVPLERFRIILPANVREFAVRYEGTIHHPLEDVGREQARGFQDTPGIIDEAGVFLSGSSGWYPSLGGGFITFAVEATSPQGWDSVSQGDRTGQEVRDGATVTRWESTTPQEEIYLVAGPYTEFVKPAGDALAMVFLHEPDSALATKYLDATASYLALYSGLIGPYPYRKFALVENFWETGFGMPSFTLLGPTIIRLPFIINTSYPHEILHNWWGNSVFPDYGKGNWSEGLTAYLADHLLKEQQGQAVDYRQSTLQKYADYVLKGRDFPLAKFTSRHSSATEAVGYGKSLMFFHMLRLELGDEAFIAGLRDFYRARKFRVTSFDDLRESFEKASRRDLRHEFDQWVRRAGAPEIRIRNVKARKRGRSYVVTTRIEQVQPGKAYRLRIPVAVTMAGKKKTLQRVVEMKGKRRKVELAVPARPIRIDVDPEFDVFRRLDRDEIPPAVTTCLGAKKMLILLPAAADTRMLAAYEELATAIANSGPDNAEVKQDSAVKALPKDRAVAILGWENRFLKKALSALSGYGVVAARKSVRIGKTRLPKKDHSVVLAARNPRNKDLGMMLIAADRPEAIPGLGRKLPHYHKYSYLAFEGDEPANTAKGRWPVLDSPLTLFLSGRSGKIARVAMGPLAPRRALAELPPVFSRERMMETIEYLASDKLKGRSLGTPELDKAADYIARKFREAGLAPAGDEGSYFQKWKETDVAASASSSRKGTKTKKGKAGLALKNVIGVIPGRNPDLADRSVVIGAHYDHLGLGNAGAFTENRGQVHPGADDNASGVAVLLEIAKTLKESLSPERSIVFVAFTGEDEGKIGSKHYVAAEKRYPASKAVAMLNLDTVGRLGRNKLLVLGAGSAREWPHIFRGAGFVAGVELEMVSEDLDSSDQKSFQAAGIPAVQLFSGPHQDYHRPTDTADKIDPDGLVKVASVAKEVIEYLANREKPLTATLTPGGETQAGPKTERKVSLGTIPDFAFKGEGVRLSGVVPGSPAEKAGMEEGDVIVRIYETPVTNLKDLSDALKAMKAGDNATIVFLRNGREMKVEAEVKER